MTDLYIKLYQIALPGSTPSVAMLLSVRLQFALLWSMYVIYTGPMQGLPGISYLS